MSTDWERYARPEDTRTRGAKPASAYAVIALSAGFVRSLAPLRVEHSPIAPAAAPPDGDHAQADILGLAASSKGDTVEIRLRLWRGHRFRICLDAPVAD